MMCPRCEKNNKENATYCPYCGLNFTDSEMAATLNTKENGQVHYQTVSQEGALVKQAQSIEENKDSIIRDYVKFLWECMKTPLEKIKDIGAEHLLFSSLNLLIVTFFSGLLITLLSRPFYTHGITLHGLVTGARMFFSSFVSFAFILLITVGIVFLLLKYVFQINLSFNEVIIKFGIYQSIPLIFVFVFSILSLLPLQSLHTLLLSLFNSIQFIVIYVMFQSYQRQAKKKLIPIYATITVWAIILILSMLMPSHFTLLAF